MNIPRSDARHIFSTKAVIGVLVGAFLPCASAEEAKELVSEFDGVLFYLSSEDVSADPKEAPEERRLLRNRHLCDLKEMLPALAKACDKVNQFDPAWYSKLIKTFGEKLNLDNAKLETATNLPTANDYLAPYVVAGGTA